MPEGDTLYKVAEALRPDLVGERLTRVLGPHGEPWPRAIGREVVEVRAVGKHLLITLDDGWVFRTHLGMHGSWHRYRPGERWMRGPGGASLVLETPRRVLVCFQAPEVEAIRVESLDRAGPVARLGPDLLTVDDAPAQAVPRARARGEDVPISVALLDQVVAAGIGNIFKCETLFLERVDPRRTVGELDDPTLLRLWTRGMDLMRANLHPGPRVTTGGDPRAPGRFWVYRRGGLPCSLCGTRIECLRQGDQARWTWWCPACQR